MDTVEQWLVKAIHNSVDFSFSLKQIPSTEFIKSFREKYEVEFTRLQLEDHGSSSIHEPFSAGLPLSSRHSSAYNMGRNIAHASQNVLDDKQEAKTADNTTPSSQMPFSEEGTSVPKFKDVFASGAHINMIDNTVIDKLPPVEYEFELCDYEP